MLEKQFGKVEVPEKEGYTLEIDIFGLRSDEILTSVTKGENGWQLSFSSGFNSTLQCLSAQTVISQHVILSDGSTVNKVVLKNRSGDGKEEKIEIVQDTVKVLEEAKKARMLMQKERNHWWSEYRRT